MRLPPPPPGVLPVRPPPGVLPPNQPGQNSPPDQPQRGPAPVHYPSQDPTRMGAVKTPAATS